MRESGPEDNLTGDLLPQLMVQYSPLDLTKENSPFEVDWFPYSITETVMKVFRELY